MNNSLPNTITLVTGATGGIGRAIDAARTAAEATVIAIDFGADCWSVMWKWTAALLKSEPKVRGDDRR